MVEGEGIFEAIKDSSEPRFAGGDEDIFVVGLVFEEGVGFIFDKHFFVKLFILLGFFV